MITDPSQFFELQQVHVKALNSVGHALIVAAQKLSNLNVTTGRSAIDSVTEAAQSLSGVKDPAELLAISSTSPQPSVEKLVSYTQDLVGIANAVTAEIGKVVEQQINESNRRMAELLEFTTANTPAGSEQAVSLLRTALAASNAAFDTASKVSRQAADWAAANFVAVGKPATTTKAPASSATKKAA